MRYRHLPGLDPENTDVTEFPGNGRPERTPMKMIRFQDVPQGRAPLDMTSGWLQTSDPNAIAPLLLNPGERIVNIETLKDPYGFATARVWIVNQ